MQENTLKIETGIVLDPVFMDHRPPDGHPERPERIEQLIKLVDSLDIDVNKYSPVELGREGLRTVHTEDHIQNIERAALKAKHNRPVALDPDTWVSEDSYTIAKKAAGSCIVLAEAIMKGEVNNAFAFVRPPGHHALTYKPMGFCLFNNIALTAKHLLNNYNLQRIAMVDIDVHHGNGTQQIFYHCGEVLTISLHEYPFWPLETGSASETGIGPGEGFNINIPLNSHSGNTEYRHAIENNVLPALKQFEPEFIIAAMGYDAHKADYISSQQLSSDFYGYFIEKLRSIDSNISLLCVLEGGYNLQALSESVEYTLQSLKKKKPQ